MVPTGAGMFSPHFLQRIVKSQRRVSGRLNTREEYRRTKGETAMWISLAEPVENTPHEELTYHYYFQSRTVRRIDLKTQFWQDGGQVNGPLCELSPPPFALVSVCCWLFC